MTRRMSVALTLDAVHARTKTVTRRRADTWRDLRMGDRLTLVEKGMGLRKGEKQVVVADVEIVSVRVEDLGLVDEAELAAEGFPTWEPEPWRTWWAVTHGFKVPVWCTDTFAWIDSIQCRRIEWRYVTEHLSSGLGW